MTENMVAEDLNHMLYFIFCLPLRKVKKERLRSKQTKPSVVFLEKLILKYHWENLFYDTMLESDIPGTLYNKSSVK